VNDEVTFTIDQAISGSGAITMTSSGAGVLVLGGTNTYTGTTTITSGTLSIATDRGLGGTSGSLTLNGGTLEVTGSSVTLSGSRVVTTTNASSGINVADGCTFTIGQSVSGTGGLTMTSSGVGTLTLSSGSGNSFSGGLTIDSGVVSVGADNQLGNTSGSLTLNGGTLDATNTFTLSSSRGAVTVSNTSTFEIASGKTVTIPQTIQDGSSSGSITLTGGGELLLEGNCTYSGTTTISAGTLALSGSGQISSSQAIAISSGATFNITGVTETVTINNLSGAGNITTGTYTLEVKANDDTSFSGSLTGSAALVVTGDNTLDFAGSTNSYSGGTTVQGGAELRISADEQLGTGSSIVLNDGGLGADGTFALGSSSTRSISVLSGSGGFDARDGYTLTVPQNVSGVGAMYVYSDDSGIVVFSSSSGNSFEGGLYVSGGTLKVSQDNQLGTAGGLVELDGGTLAVTAGFTMDDTRPVSTDDNNSQLSVASGQTLTIGQAISGSGALYINLNQTGTLVLGGSCTYTGYTAVYGGTVSLTGSGSIADSSQVEVDAILDLSGVTSGTVTLSTLSGNSNGQILGNMQPLVIIQQNGDETYSGTINSNVHGLIKQGANNLELDGVNSYTVGTTIEAGELSVGQDSSLGNTSGFLTIGNATLHITGNFTLNSSRTFTLSSLNSEINVNDGNTFIVNQTIADGSSTGGLTFTSDGEGILVLGGTNTYSGGTTIETWVVSISADAALGNASGSVTLNGGILKTTTNSFSLSNTRPVMTESSSGGIDIVGGLTLTIPQPITNGSSSGWLIVNPLSDTGTLILEGTCTYTGSTQVDAGTLKLSGNGSIANASATIINGTFDITGATYASITIPTLSGSGAIVGSSTQTLYVVQEADGTFSGGVSGIASIIKQGSATLTFTGTNSYNTGTTIGSGTLQVSSDASLGNPTTGFVAIAGGTLQVSGTFELSSTRAVSTSSSSSGVSVDNSYQFTVPQAITGTGSLTITSSGNGTIVLDGTNTFSGGMTIQSGIVSIEQDRGLGAVGGSLTFAGGTLQLTTNSVTLDSTRSITASSTAGIDVAEGTTLTIPQGISGAGGITVGALSGTGTLVLEGTSSYTGATTVNSGTLTLTGSGSIASSNAVSLSSSTVLDLTGASTTVSLNNLSGSGNVNTSSSSGQQLSITQTASNEFDGVISGAGALNLASGNFTLTLTATHTFTGTTTITAGTLALSGNGSIADSASVAVGSGTTLNITAITASSASINSLSGAGTVSMGGKTLTLTQAEDATFSGTLSGSGGSLNLNGPHTLTLSSANVSYTGGTTVNEGTLTISGSTSLSNSSSTAIASGAALDVSGATTSGVTVNTLSGAGSLIATGQTLTINQTSNESFSGVISGSGASLFYTGGSKLTVSNTDTFTGSTEISNGTIALSGSSSFANSSSMKIDSSGTLDTSAVTLSGGASINNLSGSGGIVTGSLFTVVQTTPGTFSGNVTGSAHFILQGSSALTLSGGSNTYSGGTEIQGGTLTIASDVLGNTSGSLTLSGGILQASGTFELATGRAVSTSSSSSGINVASGQTFTISQAISDGSSDGGLTLTSPGSGTLTLSGACTYHGATTVSSGILALSGSGALTNSSSTSIASGASVDISGTTSGATLNVLSGSGTLVITGKTATLNQTSDGTFRGTISGTGGSLVKMGSGTLSLTGTASYTGNTEVQAGTLALNTSVAGSISVLSGAKFSGVCTVGGDVTVDGTIAPGNSPGNMTVMGNLVLNSSSVTDITITPTTSSEIIVTGSATLGGELVIIAQSGIYLGQTQYTILTAAGGVTPGFASVTGGVPGSELSVSYSADSVTLTYMTQLRDLTLTGNALNFINYLNQNSENPALEPIFSALGVLSADQLEAAAIACTPARNATAVFTSQNTMFSFSKSISNHMGDQRLLRSMYKKSAKKTAPEESEFLTFFEFGQHHKRFGAKPVTSVTPAGSVKKMAKQEDSYSVWVNGFTEFSHQDAQNQVPSFTVLSGGFLVGVDAYLNDRGEVGAAVGYGRNAVHESQAQGNNFANLYTMTIYGTVYAGNAYIETAVWGTYDQYQTKRIVSFPGFEGKATASFPGAQVTPHIGLGYDFSFDWGSLEPFALCDWVVNFERHYTEHGASPLNMSVQGTTASMLRAEGGLSCYQSWEGEKGIIILKEKGSYVYKHPYSVGKIIAAIVGADGTFFNDSFTKTQNLVSPSFEIFFRHKKSGVFCSLLYEGEFGDGYRANEALIKIGKYF